jgi:predicted RND superfamily exporter protein
MAGTSREARFLDRLIHWRWSLLTLAALFAGLAWIPARRLSFDRSIENMFPPDEPALEPFGRLSRVFGAGEAVVALYTDPQLWTVEGMDRLVDAVRQVEQTAGVAGVMSIHSPMGDAILDEENPLAARFRDLLAGYTHGEDRETAALVVLLERRPRAGTARHETLESIRRVVEPLGSGVLAGEPVMVEEGFRQIEADGRRLARLSTVLLIAAIFVCFRSLRWAVIPIVVVQLALVWTQGLLSVAGFRLSMVSSMLTAIVTVVGVATVAHLIVRYRDANDGGLPPRDSLARALAIVASPIVWACATDAAGFGSLLVSQVGPVRDFGVMMSTGAMMVVFGVAFVVPALALVGSSDAAAKPAWEEAALRRALARLLGWIECHPRKIFCFSFVLAGGLIAGTWRTEVETDFTRNFRRGSPVVTAYERVESRLGGAAVWDVILPAPAVMDWPFISKVLALEDELRRDALGLTKVLSLADGVRAASPVDLSSVRNSLVRRTMVSTAVRTMQSRMPDFFSALYAEDPGEPGKHFLRIMLRSRERQSADEKVALIESVERICRRHFQEAAVTGYFVLLTRLVDSVVHDQWLAFLVASAAIGMMMLAALQSFRLALAALVPNALPIAMVTGLMGWLGVKINMGAAMIAAVSMGLSVDSSIHYLSAIRRSLRAGKTRDEALLEAQENVGRAMVFSTVALVIGFISLVTSEFVPTIYFGALVSLCMIGGLAGNLVILPLLLKFVLRQECSRCSDECCGR